jgi:polyisoprenoid-binding protein YceI
MKHALIVLGMLVASVGAMADSYTIDPEHTYPNFTVSHLGFSTLHGRFGKTSGKLTLDREGNTSSVEVIIDAASLDTGFDKRDKHLRSPDFFNVVEFPEITFKSTKVRLQGKGAVVEGDLTIKGVTRPVTLNVASINCGVHPFNKKQVCGFDAEATIKRSDFGIEYALPAVGDEVGLEIEIEAFKD